MNSPFKIIRGGQLPDPEPDQVSEPKSRPALTTFQRTDNRRAMMERMKARHIADRNRAILNATKSSKSV